MTGTKSKNRLAEVLTHLTCWGLILGFPFLFVIDQDESIVDWQEYCKRATVILCYSIVFYINYFSLIPKLFFCEKRTKFVLANAGIVIIFCLGIQLWQRFVFLDRDGLRRRPQQREMFHHKQQPSKIRL